MIPQDIIKVHDISDVPTVQLNQQTAEGTYFIADILMKAAQWCAGLFGQSPTSGLTTTFYAILVFLASLFVGIIVKWIIMAIVKAWGKYVKNSMYSFLRENHFFTKLTRVFPAIVFLILIEFTLFTRQTLATWLTRITWIYVVYVIANALTSMISALWEHINTYRNTRRLPLKGIAQLIKGILWIVALIVMGAILFNKSPGALLAGVGAFAAVLMLIFKDSILGVVAGVQLAENDSLHLGDWVSIPGTEVNGTVIEVSLTAVKIENWDKTISTVPPYSLISNGFKNMRNMQESKTRRIQRSYMIDADSVVETTDAMLQEFRKIPLLTDWIDKKLEQRSKGIVQDTNNSEGLVDGTIDTNLGVFRAYLRLWLAANENIDNSSTCFITSLAQTAYGIPLQVYCFTNTSSWLPYESIQAGVFEHIAATLYKFKLYIYESASGRDTIIDGYLSAGKNPQYTFGIPYPFFPAGTPMNSAIPPYGVYPPLPPQPQATPQPQQQSDDSSKQPPQNNDSH